MGKRWLVEAKPVPSPNDRTISSDYEAWRQELEGRGIFVLGGPLGDPETAVTLRSREGQIRTSDGPFRQTDGFIAGIDIIRAADRQQATEVAATHPFARHHAIEVEQFHTG